VTPCFTCRELVGQTGGPAACGDAPGDDDPPLDEAGADAVTVTVLAGAAGWLLDDAQPAASATQASAAAAKANRPAPESPASESPAPESPVPEYPVPGKLVLENPARENTAVPFMRAAPHAPLSNYDDKAGTPVGATPG
jgi:hypothetical protein